MPNIGPMELMIVLVIALIVFGPKKLPELGRSLGDGFKQFKSSISGDDEGEHMGQAAQRARLEATTAPAEPTARS